MNMISSSTSFHRIERQKGKAERSFDWLLAPLARFVMLVKTHRQMRQLHRLDDRMLKDIGLRRGDLDWAMAQCAVDDPTLALEIRRQENRLSARRMARA